jgi:hypothetical protein
MSNSANRKSVPEDYRGIDGSKRSLEQGMRRLGAANSNEIMQILIRLRSSIGQAGFDRMAEFVRSKGLRVVAISAVEGCILVSGTVAQVNETFAVEVGIYDGTAGQHRGFEGYLHLPAGLAEIVVEVVGLVEWEIEKIEIEIGKVLQEYKAGRKGTGTSSYKALDLVVPTSGPQGPVAAADFNMVGMYDIDRLVPSMSPTYSGTFGRLLQNITASPGAFNKVRLFKCLNSGHAEIHGAPNNSGTVWNATASPPDFAVTLDGLAALVQHNLTPYIVLGLFPTAVSSGPTTLPPDWTNWQTLVHDFLNSLAEALSTDPRFKGTQLRDWWFEVWNEPNFYAFWLPESDAADSYLSA